jgi:hypothetical protein
LTLLLRGGTLVNGTGAPRREADVVKGETAMIDGAPTGTCADTLRESDSLDGATKDGAYA